MGTVKTLCTVLGEKIEFFGIRQTSFGYKCGVIIAIYYQRPKEPLCLYLLYQSCIYKKNERNAF